MGSGLVDCVNGKLAKKGVIQFNQLDEKCNFPTTTNTHHHHPGPIWFTKDTNEYQHEPPSLGKWSQLDMGGGHTIWCRQLFSFAIPFARPHYPRLAPLVCAVFFSVCHRSSSHFFSLLLLVRFMQETWASSSSTLMDWVRFGWTMASTRFLNDGPNVSPFYLYSLPL